MASTLAICVVDGHQGRLRAAVLLQDDVWRACRGTAHHLDVHNVAHLRELGALDVLRPCPVRRNHRRIHLAELDGDARR